MKQIENKLISYKENYCRHYCEYLNTSILIENRVIYPCDYCQLDEYIRHIRDEDLS